MRAENHRRQDTEVRGTSARRTNRKPSRKDQPRPALTLERLEERLVLSGDPPSVVALQLLHDTGASAADGVTTDARLTGIVELNNAEPMDLLGLLVEFDHNSDGVGDGSTTTNASGNFSYRPEGLTVGTATIKARAGRTGETQWEYVFGSWQSMTFTLEADPNNTPPTLGGLGLAFDTGSSDSDGITSDPTVTGTVAHGDDVFMLRVDFDHNGDGNADGFTRTDRLGNFRYTPEGLASGAVTLQARVGEWDAGAADFLNSDWSSMTFTLDPASDLVPEATELVLVRDTLESASDGITTDPRLTGTIANDGRMEGVAIEFDHDGDGVAEDESYAGSDGKFWYLPRGLALGQVTIQARAREMISGQPDPAFGPWTSLSFTLVNDPTDSPPEIAGLSLLYDTGSSSSDAVTGDPRVTGTVTDDGELYGLRVEFDHDGDDVVDGSVLVEVDGRFAYTPEVMADGAITIRVRPVAWSMDRFEDVYGAWGELSFTLDSSENLAPVVPVFGLLRDTGNSSSDGVTSDPTVTGSVANDGSVADLVVDIDVNDDGIADAVLRSDSTGAFRYRPSSLSEGPVTVRARSWEFVIGLPAVYGAWSPFSFTLDSSADLAPVVAEVQLYDDTGESNTDGITHATRG